MILHLIEISPLHQRMAQRQLAVGGPIHFETPAQISSSYPTPPNVEKGGKIRRRCDLKMFKILRMVGT